MTARKREVHVGREYLLFESWTLIDRDEMRQRRATWPRWRQLLRPIGATIWWIGVVLGWVVPAFRDAHPWSPLYVAGTAAGLVLMSCVIGGIALEWRDRHREGRRVLGD